VCSSYLGRVCLFCVFGVLSAVCFVLSVPVQVIAWKDSSLKCAQWVVELYSLTHSLTDARPLYILCTQLFRLL